jgi:polysaccharide export outer membrane protein
LYRLAIGDSISVTVQDFPEFSFAALIDPEGQIRVPFLGKISIVGLTLDEVETKVAYELGKRYLQEDPEVIAVLTGPRPVQLTILGEINRPGYYFFGPGVSLNNVLAGVGGSTPLADLRSVIIRRRLVDGTVLEERVDLYTPLIQGKRLPEFRLQGGDTIIVSKLQIDQKDYDQTLIARTNLAQPTIRIRVLVPTSPAGLAIRDLVLPNGSTFLDAVANLPPTIPLYIKQEVTLLRFDPEQGKVVTQGLNPIQTVENLDSTQYVTLRNEDVIVVSRTLLGKVLAAFNVITQPIRDLLGFTSFVSGLTNYGFGNNNNNN